MKKGFTLVELLVVLVVIGVIIGLILPNTLKAIEEANERECASNIRSLNTAIQLCYTTKRKVADCDTIQELTEGAAYLDIDPVCPFGVDYVINPPANTGTPATVKTNTHFDSWPPNGIDHV